MDKVTQGFFRKKSKKTIEGLLVLFIMLLLNKQVSWGQQLLQWNTVGNSGTETIEPSTANDTNIASSNLTQGTITASTNGNRFGGSGWFNTGNTSAGNTLAEAVAGNDYIEFVVTPNYGYSFTPTSFVFKWDRSPTGPSNVTLRSSIDSFVADLGSVTGMVSGGAATTTDRTIAITGVTLRSSIDSFVADLGSVTGMVSGGAATTTDRTIAITGLTNISASTTFRIYGYGATATSGTGGFDCANGSTTVNVVLNGTTASTATNWTGLTNSSWTNPGNWTAGVPNQNSDVWALGSPNAPVITGNVNINSLRIDGTTLTVSSGSNLTITNGILNQSGTLIIENNANLIQVNDVINYGPGPTIVKRTGNLLTRNEYTIWSSPMFEHNLLAFSPVTLPTRFYNYNEADNEYNVVAGVSSAPFTRGAGYLIRMPDSNVLAGYNTGVANMRYEGVFTGLVNNGDISKPMQYSGPANGYNMVGNPYPSIIDAQLFITANTANIESSLYFWRKVNGAPGSAYAIYNPLGGTEASPSSEVPNGTIQVGQGFFVKAKSATNLNFTNAMRVANNANQFFKTKQVAQKDRIWLNLTNTAGVFSQALVGYTADAAVGLDIYDGKYINDSPIALTSNINNEEYTIQGRPTFNPSDVVALNFKTDVAGDYSIAIDHVDGLFSGSQDIYLVDSKTGAETNLKTGSYTFAATAAVDNSRFSLKYQKTLSVDTQAKTDYNVIVYKNNGLIYVHSGAKTINSIKVFDIQGKVLAERNNVKANATSVQNLNTSNQILIVKVTTEDNQVISKKVGN